MKSPHRSRLRVAALTLSLFMPAALCRAAEQSPVRPVFLWTGAEADAALPDSHAAFRGTFEMERDGEVEFRLLGASWYVGWLDGEYFAEGPSRFEVKFPQYQIFRMPLKAGRHVLAVQVHHHGVPTRMLGNPAPFLHAEALLEGKTIPLRWKCSPIGGYRREAARVNPQLGWIEWCDTRQVPDWKSPDFDDAPWAAPVAVARELGPLTPLCAANPRPIPHELKPLAEGRLVERFGYETDEPSARFFLRDLVAEEAPPQGVWRRYDLGRVRLARPRFVLDLPAGAVVQFASSEALTGGRVAPWITLSGGPSCNLDHFVARGGRQEFFPLTPKGGRFLEVHVIAPPDEVKFIGETVIERCYYGQPEGAFQSGDELLDRIWSVGVETHRACSEDALTDNPTRERGQWAGDVVTVGMDIAAAGFTDLRMCRRGLVQCAQSARDDGLVSGMCPGQNIFLSTYATQWVTACLHYWELTGERALLEELFPAAERNMAAFEAQRTPDGLKNSLGWGFVDWGYVGNPGPSDMAVNLHYLAAVRDMRRWCETLDRPDRVKHYGEIDKELTGLIARYFAGELAAAGDGWERIGYHRAVLGLWLGFFKGAEERAAVGFLKAHMLRCFPNDATAPRLSDPSVRNPRLITPYFAHFALPLLIERGEMDFVLDQYRKCWGWALEDGRTTWVEVFDTRWSHAHQWSGCPTWQLSRYVLGLHPRQDLGERHFNLKVLPGSLPQAEGRVPIPGADASVKVTWRREPGGLRYRLETPVPITLHLQSPGKERLVKVERIFDEILTN